MATLISIMKMTRNEKATRITQIEAIFAEKSERNADYFMSDEWFAFRTEMEALLEFF